jgi:hypothetical protein
VQTGRNADSAMLRWPRLLVEHPISPLEKMLVRRAERLHHSHRVNWMAAAVALAAVRVDPLIGLSVAPLLTGICAMADGPADDPFGGIKTAPPTAAVKSTLPVGRFIASRFARALLGVGRAPGEDEADCYEDEAELWAECDVHSACTGGVSVEWEGVHRPSVPIVLANRFDVLNSSD